MDTRNAFSGGLTVTSIGSDYDLKPGATFGPVIRNIYIIECCTGGFGTVVVNGTVFPVQKGDCYILLPGDTVIHTADKISPRRGYWCAVDGAQVGHYLKQSGIRSDAPFAPKGAFDTISRQLQTLFEMRTQHDPGADLRRSSCLYAIFGALLKEKTISADKSRIVQKAIAIMEARYDAPLTTSDIAAQVGLERSYFSTIFKAETGAAPHAYLNRLRLEKACMLMDQGYTVSLAARSVGLDPENFARIFRRHLGITPGQYQKTGMIERGEIIKTEKIPPAP